MGWKEWIQCLPSVPCYLLICRHDEVVTVSLDILRYVWETFEIVGDKPNGWRFPTDPVELLFGFGLGRSTWILSPCGSGRSAQRALLQADGIIIVITSSPSPCRIYDSWHISWPLVVLLSSHFHYHQSSMIIHHQLDFPWMPTTPVRPQVLPLFADPPCNFEEDKVQVLMPYDFHLRQWHALVAGVGTPTVAGECGPVF
jgi:hypothetical protein